MQEKLGCDMVMRMSHSVISSPQDPGRDLIISTSDFSKGAKQEAERPDATPVALMNGEQLVALLVENEIGVRRTAFSLIEVGENSVATQTQDG